KTLAAIGGPVLDGLRERPGHADAAASGERSVDRRLRLLWITPLKALANDTRRAIRDLADGVGLDWTIGLRTGDASAKERRLARAGKLDVLVTTPESLSLLLSYPDTAPRLAGLRG